jgi:hypothetical protein
VQVILVGPGRNFIIQYFAFPESMEVIKLEKFARGLPMSVTVDDGKVIPRAGAFEFVEGEEEGVHTAEYGDGLGKGEAGDMESDGADIIAVDAVLVGGQLGLGGEAWMK